MARLATFKGGVHPHDYKELSKDKGIEVFPLPKTVTILMAQQIGAPSKPIVSIGQEVRTGEPIAQAQGYVSIPQHSSVTGKVKRIVDVYTPLGTLCQAVEIESTGEDILFDGFEPLDPNSVSIDDLKKRIVDCGLVGMGGATFPTHVKLTPPKEFKIDTLIINGVECEPYLTADYRLMLEQADGILQGATIFMRILGLSKCYIGIENNKPDVIELMKEKVKGIQGLEVVALKVKYPQGAEKQLIEACTGRQVPTGTLPMAASCLVQNVGTTYAAYEAVIKGKPLIERVCTVTGSAVPEEGRKNLQVRIGTSVKEILNYCGVKDENLGKLISGGPMMGLAQKTTDIFITKGSSGLVCMDKAEASVWEPDPCIRCARCIDHCPIHLMPCIIAGFVEMKMWEEAKEHNILDCIKCGTCSYVCPAKRRLVQAMKLGEAEVRALMRKK